MGAGCWICLLRWLLFKLCFWLLFQLTQGSMQCAVNHAISILSDVWKHWLWLNLHLLISTQFFRVFRTSYYQCCWIGWRGAWRLDKGDCLAYFSGPELQLGMWINTGTDIRHVRIDYIVYKPIVYSLKP